MAPTNTKAYEAGETEYTLKLRSLFSTICDPHDWRKPIRATVPKEKASTYLEAIEYFTATKGNVVEDLGGTVTIEADGYRAGPAGDH